MEEEANEEEGYQDKNPPPRKRIRTETMSLDADETEIASVLRPIQQVAPQWEQDKTRRDSIEKGDSGAEGEGEGGGSEGGGSEQGGDAVDDFSGDVQNGFEDNGVCPLPFHMVSMWLISVLDVPL
jgi:hypothetical protein